MFGKKCIKINKEAGGALYKEFLVFKHPGETHTKALSFERDFPLLCFALATGVGKTRLMGSMITWLF